jgi:hypothetical protein
MDEIKQITAEEFLKSKGEEWFNLEESEILDIMIEFAKMHVESALKAKIEAMEEHMDGGYSLDEIDSFTYNAYPLDNIK